MSYIFKVFLKLLFYVSLGSTLVSLFGVGFYYSINPSQDYLGIIYNFSSLVLFELIFGGILFLFGVFDE